MKVIFRRCIPQKFDDCVDEPRFEAFAEKAYYSIFVKSTHVDM